MILSKMRNHIKWVLALFCIIFVVSVFFTYGLGDRRRQENDKAPRNHVVAVIDGKKLYLADLYKQMQAWAARNNVQPKEDTLHECYQKTLDDLVANLALEKEVKARGIAADPALVNAKLKAMENQYVTKEQFMQNLSFQGLTVDKLKDQLARQVAVEEVIRQGVGDYKPDEEQMKSLFDVLKNMQHEAVYRPSGIEGHHAEFSDQTQAAKMTELLRQGTPFKEALVKVDAKTLGVHTDGEHTSFIPDSLLENTYKDTLGKLADGDVADPVQLPDGSWLVYQRLRHEDARFLSYEEAKPVLEQLMRSQEMPVLQAKFIESLKKNVKVEIKDPELFAPQKTAEGEKSGDQAGDEATPTEPTSSLQGEESPQAEEPAPASESVAPRSDASQSTSVSTGTKVATVSGKATDKLDLDEVNSKRPNGGVVTSEGKALNAAEAKPASSASERKTVGGN